MIISLLFPLNPDNVQEYVNEVLGEFWKIDPDLLQKTKDKLNGKDHK